MVKMQQGYMKIFRFKRLAYKKHPKTELHIFVFIITNDFFFIVRINVSTLISRTVLIISWSLFD